LIVIFINAISLLKLLQKNFFRRGVDNMNQNPETLCREVLEVDFKHSDPFNERRSWHVNKFTVIAALTMIALIAVVTLAQIQTPLFDTWRSFDTAGIGEADYPTHGKVADFNGDGHPDLAVVYRAPALYFGPPLPLTLMFGNGDGTFGDPIHYLAQAAYFLESGDLDNDGDEDIVVAEWGSDEELSTIALFFNQGDGTFAPRQERFIARKPRSVAIADLDNDNDLDLVVAAVGTANDPVDDVAVLYNDGTGTFSNPVMFFAGESPLPGFDALVGWSLAAGDLNGDTFPDLVVGHQYQHCSVLLNDSLGGFGPPTTYVVGEGPWGINKESGVTLVDAEQDGDLDIVFSCQFMEVYVPPLPDETGAVSLFRNQGDGTFAPYEIYTLVEGSTGTADIATDDVTGDGWDDIVVCWVGDGEVGWGVLPADGIGGFGAATRYIAGKSPTVVCLVDIDGDLDIDVVIPAEGSRAVSVHLNPGDADFSTHPVYPLNGIDRDMDAGDIDNDGDEDIASCGFFGVRVFRNLGDGTFAPYDDYPSSQVARKVKLRDLNSDGLLDLVWADDSFSPPYNFKTRMNTGGGNFGPLINWPVGTCGTWDLGVFDIDNDGDLDVLLVDLLACFAYLDKFIYVNKNNGDGTFAPPYTVLSDAGGMFGIAAGDFDEDGNLDLATTTSLGINTFPGNGDGTFGPQVLFTGLQENTHDLVAHDLNGDGHVDLVGQGAGGYPSSTPGAHLTVLLGNGDGTFQTRQIYAGDPSGSTGMDIGDVDQDGDPDVLLSNYYSHDVSVHLNRGDGTFEEPHQRFGAAGNLIDIRVRDFTGDGVLDFSVGTSFNINSLGVQVIPGIGSIPTRINDRSSELVKEFKLEQCYPNPFNPSTRIQYLIPQTTIVVIKVFDILGNEIETLVNEEKQTGTYELTWYADNLPSGVYFYRLQAGSFVQTKKMVLMK
jgi:hypothetical protein